MNKDIFHRVVEILDQHDITIKPTFPIGQFTLETVLQFTVNNVGDITSLRNPVAYGVTNETFCIESPTVIEACCLAIIKQHKNIKLQKLKESAFHEIDLGNKEEAKKDIDLIVKLAMDQV